MTLTKNNKFNDVLRQRKEEGLSADPNCEGCGRSLEAQKVYFHISTSQWICSGCFIGNNSKSNSQPRQVAKETLPLQVEGMDEVSRLKNKVNMLRGVLMQILEEVPEEK